MKIWLVLGVLMALCGTAAADVEEARKAYDRATTLYNLQRYDEALTTFQRAYEEKHDAAFLFNIAQCQRQLGRYDAAAKSYRAYLNSSAEPPANAEQVRKLIGDMEQAAQIERGKQPVAPAPAASQATQPSQPAPAAVVAAAPPAKPRRHWYRSGTGWTLATVGVLGIGVGAGLAGLGYSYDSDAANATTLPTQRSFEDRSKTFETAGWSVFGVGVASAAFSGLVFWLESR